MKPLVWFKRDVFHETECWKVLKRSGQKDFQLFTFATTVFAAPLKRVKTTRIKKGARMDIHTTTGLCLFGHFWDFVVFIYPSKVILKTGGNLRIVELRRIFAHLPFISVYVGAKISCALLHIYVQIFLRTCICETHTNRCELSCWEISPTKDGVMIGWGKEARKSV